MRRLTAPALAAAQTVVAMKPLLQIVMPQGNTSGGQVPPVLPWTVAIPVAYPLWEEVLKTAELMLIVNASTWHHRQSASLYLARTTPRHIMPHLVQPVTATVTLAPKLAITPLLNQGI